MGLRSDFRRARTPEVPCLHKRHHGTPFRGMLPQGSASHQLLLSRSGVLFDIESITARKLLARGRLYAIFDVDSQRKFVRLPAPLSRSEKVTIPVWI